MTGSCKTPPGLLNARIDPDVLMMVCTAGHVDHGKTELVRLLTGCRTDRLKAEQERGLTIEAGFAPCWLGGNLCVGIVDVPGHEKFIKNMVAGVSGIELTILVIAADDGIMPQTVEHVEIMELLGVGGGLVALTKCDRVDSTLVEQRKSEIGVFLAPTFLAGASICALSSLTMEGYDEFYGVLKDLVRRAQVCRRSGLFRMPIERAFSREGFGTVVSGIPLEGSVSVGEELEVVPGERRARVRRIERFGHDTRRGEAGQCLAINLPALVKTPPQRGQVLASPGSLRPARRLFTHVRAIRALERPLRNGTAMRLHWGTAETGARMFLLDRAELAPATAAPAVLVLDDCIAPAAGDRFILRRVSPPWTAAGGEILWSDPTALRPRKKEALERLTRWESIFGAARPTEVSWSAHRLEFALLEVFTGGATTGDLALECRLKPDQAHSLLASLVVQNRVISPAEGVYIHPLNYGRALATAKSQLQAAVEQNNALCVGMEDLKRQLALAPQVWTALWHELNQTGVARQAGGKVVLEQAATNLESAERESLQQIRALFERAGFQAPRPDEIAGLLYLAPVRAAQLLEHLVIQGELFLLTKNVMLNRRCLEDAEQQIVRIVTEQGTLDSADFKHVIHSSRKYALAILDWFDARGLTVRSGNLRKLAPDFERETPAMLDLRPRRALAITALLLASALAMLLLGASRTHKVYDRGNEDFGVQVFSRISERELVRDATFGGVQRDRGRLYSTYDRSERTGRQACPT